MKENRNRETQREEERETGLKWWMLKMWIKINFLSTCMCNCFIYLCLNGTTQNDINYYLSS